MIEYNQGHRQRIRNKILKGAGETMADYEILEVLLTYVVPRKDVKPLAKTLISKFKNIQGVLQASKEKLLEIDGIGNTIVSYFKTLETTFGRMMTFELESNHILTSWRSVEQYCHMSLAYKDIECVLVIYLDSRYRVIEKEIQTFGTVNETIFYNREIVRRSMHHNAVYVIISHNHPSGVPSPSVGDIRMTQELEDVLTPLKVYLIDHLIIGREGNFSFRNNEMLRNRLGKEENSLNDKPNGEKEWWLTDRGNTKDYNKYNNKG